MTMTTIVTRMRTVQTLMVHIHVNVKVGGQVMDIIAQVRTSIISVEELLHKKCY